MSIGDISGTNIVIMLSFITSQNSWHVGILFDIDMATASRFGACMAKQAL